MKSPVIFRVFKDNQIHVVKQFIDKDQITFGNNAEVDVDLDASEVSTIHCLVEKRGDQFFLCDLGSVQGTFKKGQQVLDEVLNSGDEFNVGPFKVVFFVGAPKVAQTNADKKSEIVIEPTPVIAQTKTPPQKNEQDFSNATPLAKEPESPVSAAKTSAVVKPKTEVKPVVQKQEAKPEIKAAPFVTKPVSGRNLSAKMSLGRKRGTKTYAPADQIPDLRKLS